MKMLYMFPYIRKPLEGGLTASYTHPLTYNIRR